MRPKLSKRSQFGTALQKLRRAKGLTQEQLAHKINEPKRLIVYYENELTGPPSSKNLITLANALETTPEALLFPDKEQVNKRNGKTNDQYYFTAFKKFANLQKDNQQTVIDLINSLVRKEKKTVKRK